MASVNAFLLLLIAELTGHTSGIMFINGSPQAHTAPENSYATFSCEIDITEVCNQNGNINPQIHIDWWSSLVNSALLTGPSNFIHGDSVTSVIEVINRTSADTTVDCNAQNVINSLITVAATSKSNMSSFQCAVSIKRGSPCTITDNTRIFSRSALLRVTKIDAPPLTTTTSSPTTTTTVSPTTQSSTLPSTTTMLPTSTVPIDCVPRVIETEKELQIAKGDLEETQMLLQKAQNDLQVARSINYVVGILLAVVTSLLLILIIFFAVRDRKARGKFKMTQVVSDSPTNKGENGQCENRN